MADGKAGRGRREREREKNYLFPKLSFWRRPFRKICKMGASPHVCVSEYVSLHICIKRCLLKQHWGLREWDDYSFSIIGWKHAMNMGKTKKTFLTFSEVLVKNGLLTGKSEPGGKRNAKEAFSCILERPPLILSASLSPLNLWKEGPLYVEEGNNKE